MKIGNRRYDNPILWLGYWLEIQWVRISPRKKSGEKLIPKGVYCYTIDTEREKSEPLKNGGYWIKTCPYYRNVGRGMTACAYVGFFGFDIGHYDQCKICGVNIDNQNDNQNDNQTEKIIN